MKSTRIEKNCSSEEGEGGSWESSLSQHLSTALFSLLVKNGVGRRSQEPDFESEWGPVRAVS